MPALGRDDGETARPRRGPCGKTKDQAGMWRLGIGRFGCGLAALALGGGAAQAAGYALKEQSAARRATRSPERPPGRKTSSYMFFNPAALGWRRDHEVDAVADLRRAALGAKGRRSASTGLGTPIGGRDTKRRHRRGRAACRPSMPRCRCRRGCGGPRDQHAVRARHRLSGPLGRPLPWRRTRG